jgi:hypothetical protein
MCRRSGGAGILQCALRVTDEPLQVCLFMAFAQTFPNGPESQEALESQAWRSDSK